MFSVTPLGSIQVDFGVVVPGTEVATLPPASGVPFEFRKTCCPLGSNVAAPALSGAQRRATATSARRNFSIRDFLLGISFQGRPGMNFPPPRPPNPDAWWAVGLGFILCVLVEALTQWSRNRKARLLWEWNRRASLLQREGDNPGGKIISGRRLLSERAIDQIVGEPVAPKAGTHHSPGEKAGRNGGK